MNTEYKHTLTRGSKATIIVDSEDAHLIHKYKINLIKPDRSYTRYVVCYNRITRKYVGLLHRLIMKAWPNEIIDHHNGNGLDCRKINLRRASGSLNQQNRRQSRGIEKGVYLVKKTGNWAAEIKVNKRKICLGTFRTQDEAVKARFDAEEKYHPYAGFGTQSLPRGFRL